MSVRLLPLAALALALLLSTPAPSAQTTAPPSTISYQGVLTDAAGVPVADGSYTVALALHETATSGSATYAETHAVTTSGGVFAVEIGAGTPTTGTWATVAFDRSWWLATTVNGTTLTPRTRLLAAPYARSLTPGARIGAPTAGSALTAVGIIETTAGGIRYPDGTTQTTASTGLALPFTASANVNGYLFNLTNTNATGGGIQATTENGIAVRGESTGIGTGVVGTGFLTGVRGISTVTSLPSTGVLGESVAPTGYGVRGNNDAATGNAYGVYGRSSASTTGVGVYGIASATTGATDGVWGVVTSTSGTGVRGSANASTGTTYGVYGSSSSTSGSGVYGTASAAGGRGVMGTGGTYGGHFETGGTTGAGVYGEGTSTTGFNYGGFFRSASTSGRAVYAQATSETGSTYGVYGTNNSTSGVGVYGTATAATGSTEGVYGSVPSTSGIGVRGHATATTGSTYGGYFRNYSSTGRGVFGWASAASGNTFGGYFQAASPNGTAVYGTATSNSGAPYGVIGTSAGTSGRGVYGEATGTTGIGMQGRAAATSGVNYGAYFESASTSGRGVVGEAEAASGTTYGGYFSSSSASGMGLYAVNFAGGLAARVAGSSRFDGNMEFYEGNGVDLRIQFDVDEGGDAPSIKLRRAGTTVLELDADHNGDSRVITQELEITGGSDLAEAFDVAPTAETGPAPGLVVSIDPAHPGRLAVSATPYDRLVAGVMSGAGGVEAGLIMGQRGSVADGEHAVALVGRVYVWADATHGAIRPGDFLTSSATPGHAMLASDPVQRAGAVIGKAMTALESGRGLVLVLVSLQ